MTPERVRALTERLVAIRSVSPDPRAETECARALAALLPPDVERGEWWTADGRPVLWAFVPGRAARAVLMLGHYDTVGIDGYRDLESPGGETIALDPAALRAALLDPARAHLVTSSAVRADLADEARRPGTWMFGRGALDMKSGLAAGVAALERIAHGVPPAGGVLFVATPDEEHQSEGMKTAVQEILRLREARGLELIGVLNLDYATEPAIHCGVMGKLLLGCYVIGSPAHVGDPSRGADALQIAAAIVTAIGRASELVDAADGRRGAPPAVLRLDDLRTRYSIEPVVECLIELNVLSLERPVTRTIELFRARIASALVEAGMVRAEVGDAHSVVITLAELKRAAGDSGRFDEMRTPRHSVGDSPTESAIDRAQAATDDPRSATSGESNAPPDARAATLARLRQLCRRAGITAPAVVLHVLPPFYPAAAPGTGTLTRAARALARDEGLLVHDFYPFITDASYVAWRGQDLVALAAEFPALGREYRLPWREASELDLDVVNLGPWGRDAHGLFERVRCDFAFERLPDLIVRLIEQALTE